MTTKNLLADPSHAVAFLGLGVMGYPMAGHLARAGHRVTVYNRTAAKADAVGRRKWRPARATPRAAATARTSCSPASATTTTCAR